MLLDRMAMLVGIVALLVPACFHPSYDHPACGPNRECPSGLICSIQLICEEEGSAIRDASADVADARPATRTRTGLIRLWEFDEIGGTTIADTGDVTPKVPLTVTVGAVTFSGGTMTPTGVAVIEPATRSRATRYPIVDPRRRRR